jgi:hypothetical protein
MYVSCVCTGSDGWVAMLLLLLLLLLLLVCEAALGSVHRGQE